MTQKFFHRGFESLVCPSEEYLGHTMPERSGADQTLECVF